jgi:hypothetical protein
MSYDNNRISEQLRVLEPEINNFILRYNASNGPAGGGGRQTVFFFPGGMASRLVRAKSPYDPAGPPNQMFAYEEIWINVLTFLGRARYLKMTTVAGPPFEYRDKGNKIIVSDALMNLLGYTPYVKFNEWCIQQGLDYFVFPWDWRRAIWDVGDLFIKHFLPHFRELVMAGCNSADPLARFSLIGHSAGGMVVNWALRSGAPIMAGLDQVITVATPFYGYGGQLHRWFEGERYLNGPFGIFKRGIVQAICSFPGCYAWMFLPHATFLVEQAALAADPDYPLSAYPSTDRTTGAIADPYNPQSTGKKGRYPSSAESGFQYWELLVGGLVVNFLASPLSQAQANRFWNIRADTLEGNTLDETTWDWVPPTSPSPIRDVSVFGGDSVQPAWSTRHVRLESLAQGHVISIRSALAEHTKIMDVRTTKQEIAGILGIPFS